MPAHEKRLGEHLPGHSESNPDEQELAESEDIAALAGAAPSSMPANVMVQPAVRPADSQVPIEQQFDFLQTDASGKQYVAYTIKMPSDQLAALQSIWLELKRLYGTHSPDKSGMIQQAVAEWLRRWDGPDRAQLLRDLLEIRQDTRRRQYRK